MKKNYLLPALLIGVFATSGLQAQTIDMNQNSGESDVTITLDLQPILELQMSTPDQIDFVFDNINSYMSGITRYGATVLKVNSTVDWDLAAIGTSGTFETSVATPWWDNPVQYKTPTATSVATIPLDVLELQQIPRNPATGAAAIDTYNSAFPIYSGGVIQASTNAIEVGRQAATTTVTMSDAVIDKKMIAGVLDAIAGAGVSSVGPGSYLNTVGAGYSAANYKYTISYRLLPGLPAKFPMRDADNVVALNQQGITDAGAEYANPGVYTMEVRYILTEDQ